MLFKFECRVCGGKLNSNNDYGQLQCVKCGRFLDGTLPPDDDTIVRDTKMPAPANSPGQRWQLGGLLYDGPQTPWIRTMIGSLRAQLHHGQREEAIQTCHRLLGMDRDFIDAHLWIGRLIEDKATKRRHLEAVLAQKPNNAEATRLLMVLNGVMTEEEAERSRNLHADNVQVAEGDVEAGTVALLCPVCRGALTVADDGTVTCAFCGYADENTSQAVRADPGQSLTIALIKQRGQAVRWKVGERKIHCDECGAERVLPPGKMSSRCPFCDSNQVLVQDNHGAFRQPDSILKFRVNRQKAEASINESLNSVVEQVKGWFTDNRVDRMRLEGVFLPFWVFDVFGIVRIVEEKQDSQWGVPAQVERREVGIDSQDIAIPAVKSPPRKLLLRLGRYDYSQRIPYTPKLLAKFAAELYQIDFDAASLDARSMFRERAVSRYGSSTSADTKRTLTAQVDYIDMELFLVPVWVATITEKDRDVRMALVNGQTGKTVLGRAGKPNTR